MHMATPSDSLHRLQPVLPLLFDGLQYGLDKATQEHNRDDLRRRTDPLYFSYGARRHASEYLMQQGLLVTDVDGEKSALQMSGLQVQHNGSLLWIFRAKDEVPVPGHSTRKRNFYAQQDNLLGWDNLLLLWNDNDGVLADPMYLVRPTGGDHRRRNLTTDWSVPITREIGSMRVEDLALVKPDYHAVKFAVPLTA